MDQLIATVCEHPTGSREWRRAMTRLLLEIQKLPGIAKSSHPDYLQALNITWDWVSRNICRLFANNELRVPIDRSLVSWVNGYLYWRIRDLYEPEKNFSLDVPVPNSESGTTMGDNLPDPGLSGLDAYIARVHAQKIKRIAIKLIDYIEQDPEGKLRNCCHWEYAECNCQILIKRRLLKDPPDTFKQIAEDLNMPLSKLTNLWAGKCKRLLQRIGKELGYQEEEE